MGASHFQLFRRLVRSRISLTDEHLGFFWDSRPIAFEKLADDTRRSDFHREFQSSRSNGRKQKEQEQQKREELERGPNAQTSFLAARMSEP
jgi:hypothetical protein